MKISTRILTVPVAALLLASFAPGLDASVWNKKTRLTVHETIQVPGAVLPPGNYVVKLADSQANRHIVQFFNEDQSKLYSTVLAIPNSRMNNEITGDTELVFYETRGTEPPALRAWFYPGDTFGQEFVYPKSEAQVIARNSGRDLPTIDDAAMSELKSHSTADNAPEFNPKTRVYVWSPTGKEIPQAEADAHSSKMDRDPQWRERQRAYRNRGGFDAIIVARSQALPTNLSGNMTRIHNVMARIEEHSDNFEKRFNEALDSSTVKIEDRDELKNMVDRFEDSIDKLNEEYKENDLESAHKALRRSLEIGASVNRFMLRSEFGKAEQAWDAVRYDLNTLASAHTYPKIQIFAIRDTRPR